MSWLSYIKSHKNKIRSLYWVVVVLGMVFIVLPMFVFFYRFDEDQVKRMIVDQFDSSYLVEVNGQVKPKFWHGLSLEISNISISTKDDVPLINIKSTSCQLSWLNLALGQYKVKRLALNGVDFNENNMANYQMGNLINLSNIPNSAFASLSSVDIYGIRTVGEQQTYRISDGVLKLKQSGAGAIFKFGIKLADQNTYIMTEGYINSINNDLVKFNDFNMRIYNSRMRINLTAKTSLQLKDKKLILDKLDGNLALDSYSGKLSADELTVTLLGAKATNGMLSLNFNNDFASQSVSAEFNQLISPQFKKIIVNQLQIKYLAKLDNNQLSINSNLENFLIESNGHITSNTCINHLNFSSPNLSKDGINALLSGICEYVPTKSLINMNLVGNLDDAPLKLALKIFNKDKKPYIVAKGDIDNLDLSRLVNKTKLMPLYYDDSKLPFEWLSLFDMDADLSIGHFALDRINLDHLSTEFNVANNKLEVNKIQADVYNGALSGNAEVAKIDNGYNIKIKEEIKNLSIQSMFKELFNVQAISGKANLKMDVFADNVVSYEDLHKLLNGKVIIDANQGAFQGVDFNLFVNPEGGLSLTANKSTVFDRLSAELNFVNGVSKNGNLNFSSPYVIATGSGTLNFVETSLDYNMAIRSALPQNDEKIHSVLIPVAITGDLFSPKINIQNIHLFMGELKPAKIPVKVKRVYRSEKQLKWGSKARASKAQKAAHNKETKHPKNQ